MPPPRESTARRISMSALGSRGPSMWERLALCEQVWRNVDQDCLAEYEYGNCFWIVQIEQKHWILMMLCWSWQAAVPEQVMCFRPSLSTYWSTAHCVDRYCAFFKWDMQNDLHDYMICHILTVSSQAWLVHCACEEASQATATLSPRLRTLRQKLKILLSTQQVTSCTDVDECYEGRHTCHPSTTCRYTLSGSVVINFSNAFQPPPTNHHLCQYWRCLTLSPVTNSLVLPPTSSSFLTTFRSGGVGDIHQPQVRPARWSLPLRLMADTEILRKFLELRPS